jgi:uncharacterized protein (DUF2344 family)
MIDVEEIGVSYLNGFIAFSDYLKPIFYKNDKTPSFDGDIYLYSNNSKAKKFLMGKISVQIKCTGVSIFSTDTIKFDFYIEDLANYSKVGGIILFVVEVKERLCKIFYKPLLPFDLKEILKSSSTQKQVRLELPVLDETNTKEIEDICANFLFHLRKQYSTVDYSLSLAETSEVKFYIVPNGIPFEDYVLTHQIPLYGKRHEKDIECFIQNLNVSSIGHTIPENIKIDDKVFYTSYEIEKSKDEVTIKVGKSINIYLEKKKLDFSLIGTIYEQITDCDFLISLLSNKSVTFLGENGGVLTIDNYTSESVLLKNIINTKELLRNTVNLLELFRINPNDLDISKISLSQLDKKSFSNLTLLINYFINIKPLDFVPNKLGIHFLSIGNISIGIFINKKDDLYELSNLFDALPDIKFSATTMNDVTIDVSLFTFINKDNLLTCSNLNLKTVFEDIVRIPVNEDYINLVNIFCLENIKAYDASGRQEFWDFASRLFSWIYGQDINKDIAKLNILQLSLRKRALKDEEIIELFELEKIYSEDNRILCAINILLENKANVKQYFSKLSEPEKEEFIQFPIYFLAKKLKLIE